MEPSIDREEREASWLSLNVMLVGTLFVGTMFISEVGGLAPADLVLGLCIVHLAISFAAGRTRLPEFVPGTDKIAASLAFFLLVATISTLLFDGDIFRIVADAVSFLYLLVPVALLAGHYSRESVRALAGLVWLCSIVFCAATILGSDGTTRAAGLMQNPNMAAAWLGLATILLLAETTLPWWLRYPVAVLLAYAIFATDSYTAFLAISASGIYLLASTRHRIPAVILGLAVAITAKAFSGEILRVVPQPDRIQQSTGSREEIWAAALSAWADHPFGIGHGNFSRLDVYRGFETHNDYLGVLVECGPIGLLALLSIAASAYAVGGRITRAAMIFIGVNWAFHNSLNFRHLWLMLALALVFDAANRVQAARVSDFMSPGAKAKVPRA